MIKKRIELLNNRDTKNTQDTRLGMGGFLLSLPWCCIAPVFLSLIGFLGAAGSTRIFVSKIFYPLFILSILFLARAGYLSFYRKKGSKVSRIVVFISIIGALILWGLRFGLFQI